MRSVSVRFLPPRRGPGARIGATGAGPRQTRLGRGGYCAGVDAGREGFLLCLARLRGPLPGGASFPVWNYIISVHDKAGFAS